MIFEIVSGICVHGNCRHVTGGETASGGRYSLEGETKRERTAMRGKQYWEGAVILGVRGKQYLERGGSNIGV